MGVAGMERRDEARERTDTEGRPRGVRSFVAVVLPEEVRRVVYEAAGALRRDVPGVAWVKEENLHVTLRFLGSQEPAALARITEALRAAAAGLAPFPASVEGFGAFPSPRAPRVVWAGIGQGAGELRRLHHEVEAALAACGVAPEGRAFHPHVTLGRVRDPRRPPAVAWPARPFRSGLTVAAVDLVRSDLHPAGARYTTMARAALSAPPAEPPLV
jgi:2'-5' RNA ligase